MINMIDTVRESINVDEGLKRVMNNKKLYTRLLGNFTGRKFVTQIEEATEKGDFGAVLDAVHALKGVAANLAMFRLTAVASQIESLAKNGESPVGLLPELNEALEKTDHAISLVQNESFEWA